MTRLLLLALLQQIPGPDLVYVANQDAALITVVDASRLGVTDTIDLRTLGFSPTARPHHIVVEPDGAFWYASLIGDGRVLKFDRANRLVGQAAFEAAGMLALHPTRDLLYVTRSMTAVNPPQRIGVITRSSMAIDEVDVFLPRPHAVAVDPRGTHVYVGSLGEDRIASLDVETLEVELVDVPGAGSTPHAFVQFAISPTAPVLVATTELTARMWVFDISRAGSPRRLRSIEVNPAPWDPVFTPDGRFIYFGNQRANTVTVVDAASWTVASVIEGEELAEPYGSAVSTDGRYVFIANRNLKAAQAHAHASGSPSRVATLVVIDTATRRIAKVIEVPGDATGVGTRPPPLAPRR